ncbi:unnamed protein product [Paramecium sonneborni]|uniref:Uncharacterized protein n=1 Tax=Paramecium sonneborni TaxID=65129 RepID=A0A8S1MYI9_9CILI|nr:unnamed protein product [Paramecium sonneborni]
MNSQIIDLQAQETQNQYQNIINEVIGKLKKISDKGQLQMSESDIQTFKDFWQNSLKAIQEGKENRIKTNISHQIKQNNESTIEQEPSIVKKIKTNVDTQIIKKEEDDDANSVQHDNENQLDLSDDSNDETSYKEKNFDEKKLQESQQKYMDYKNNKNESMREKTLFDKIRELDQLKNLVKVEEQDDDDTEEPKVFDTQFYAQKINTENVVSRIRVFLQPYIAQQILKNEFRECSYQEQIQQGLTLSLSLIKKTSQ